MTTTNNMDVQDFVSELFGEMAEDLEAIVTAPLANFEPKHIERVKKLSSVVKKFSSAHDENETISMFSLIYEIRLAALNHFRHIQEVEFTLNISRDVPSFTWGNSKMLNSSLLNVIRNSINHTTHGYIKVDLNYDSGLLFARIENTGETIPQELLHDINTLERENSNDYRYGRSGYGLKSIQRMLVNNGGGFSIKNTNSGVVNELTIPISEFKGRIRSSKILNELHFEDSLANEIRQAEVLSEMTLSLVNSSSIKDSFGNLDVKVFVINEEDYFALPLSERCTLNVEKKIFILTNNHSGVHLNKEGIFINESFLNDFENFLTVIKELLRGIH